MNDYSPLPKESFIPAEWLGQDADSSLEGITPRWQGYAADLPARGETIVYPLRENAYGPVLPHVYASRIRHENRSTRNGALTQVHSAVSALYEHNGKVNHDYASEHFQSLISELGREPYTEQPELATTLQQVFESYKDIREARRVKYAEKLSRTIHSAELYVVAADSSEPIRTKKPRLYAARLAGIVSLRAGSRMNYKLVVQDPNGDKGLLPDNFFVPAGVCAPASVA